MWVRKNNYSTNILANGKALSSRRTEIQLVRFHKGKYSHYHKKKTEFFYFLKGSGEVIVGKRKLQLKSGSYLLIRPNTVHEFINKSDRALEAIMIKTNSNKKDTFIE